MGIIQKQTIKGSLYSYIGVAIGFITVGVLFPKFLKPEEIGVLNLLVAFSTIFAQLSSLGMNSVTSRLFSYFRSEKNNHHGYVNILLKVIIIGFVITMTGFLVLKPLLIKNNIEKSNLFIDYLFLIIPLTFFTLIFNVLDNYNKVLYNAVLGTFLKEFIQRVLILSSIVLIVFNIISFSQFVILYVFSLSFPSVAMLMHLIVKKEFSLKRERNFIDKNIKKSIIGVAVFGVISGFSSFSVVYIDKIMINSMLDVASTGIYATTAFFGAVILIPSRSLLKIASAIIADAWKENNLNTINEIYYKSCINQFIIATLIFIGIWANIDNVFKIIPSEFSAGKYVIFFVCLANVIDMGTGANGIIISLSRYYYWQSYLIIFLAVFVVITNYIFIPIYGIVGAGIATAISTFIYNLSRYLFLYRKYKFQPFNYKFIIVILIGVGTYLINKFIPVFDNYIVDVAIRSSVIASLFLLLIYVTKVSDDINNSINRVLTRFLK